MARVPRYEPDIGLTRLETVRASRAAVDQRRGRAGRTEPGVCYRLWDEPQTASLAAYTQPEILSADLSTLVLDLAQERPTHSLPQSDEREQRRHDHHGRVPDGEPESQRAPEGVRRRSGGERAAGHRLACSPSARSLSAHNRDRAPFAAATCRSHGRFSRAAA